jgi:hypothetical protein
LLTSIALASEGNLGSQVIVCTDGQANVGLGLTNRKEREQESKRFYAQCGEYAKSNGVTVHIVTILGTECKIDAVSPVAEMTNGEIERVDPKDIHKNFNEFLGRFPLAT